MGEANYTLYFFHVAILELQIPKLHFNQIKLNKHFAEISLSDLNNLPKSELWCQKITMSMSREVNGNSEGGRDSNLKILKKKV